jgi:hypothetical protein
MTPGKIKFDELKDRYISNFKRTNSKNCDVTLSYEDGFVIIKVKTSLSSGKHKHRISEFEKMTLTLEGRPDYSERKSSEKKVFEKKLNTEEMTKEDGGQAMIFTISEPFEEENGMFVRIQSWDENKEHKELKKFEGRKVRITIETID